MNVLCITYGLPYPPHSGARARDFFLLREIAKQHRVTCACLLEQPDEARQIAALETFGIRAIGIPPADTTIFQKARAFAQHRAVRRPLATFDFWNTRLYECVQELTTGESYDIVQIEHSFLVPYLDALPKSFRGKTILDLHNIGGRQYARLAALPLSLSARAQFWLKARLMQNWEAQHAARFDRVLTVSEKEAAWLRAENPALRVSVVENGVDTRAIPFLAQSENRAKLLFVGTLGYAPNADGLQWFGAEILPQIQRTIPEVSLQIVGRATNARMRAFSDLPNVSLAANVSGLESFYRDAEVVVVPLRAGGGTRLKILEAMAYGRAIVSTHLGAEGLDVRDGEDLLLADTPRAFAARVIELLQNRAERERIAYNARQLAETRWAWSHLGTKLLSIYDELAAV